jgi:hypothetical protein
VQSEVPETIEDATNKAPMTFEEFKANLNKRELRFPPLVPENLNVQDFMETKERRVLMAEYIQVVSQYPIKNLETINRDLNAFLSEKVEGTPYEWYFEQMVALEIVRMATKEEDLSEAEKAILSTETQVLVDYNYHRSKPISQSLILLKGYISDDKIKTIASDILNNAKTHDVKMEVLEKEAIARLTKEGKKVPNARMLDEVMPWDEAEAEGKTVLEALAQ